MRWRVFQIPLIGLIAAIPIANTSPSSAQTPEGDPNNAATWYRAAYAEYKSVKFEMDVYEHSAAFEADPDRGPDAIARKYVRQYREAINLTKRATRREFCDFGAYDPLGDADSQFRIGNIRALAFMVRDDFYVRIFDGDVASAIEHLCDLIRISRHNANHPAMVACLSGAALLKMADNLITFATDRGAIGPGEATRLLRELNELKGDDPFGMADRTASSHAAMIASMRRRFTGEEGMKRFVEYVLPFYRQQGDADAIKVIEAVNPEEIEKIIERLDALGRRHIAAIQARDDAAISVLEEEQKRGEHDRFASMFIAGGKHILKPMRDTQVLLKDRRAMLQGIIDGTIDPMSLANAACWYIRAGVKLEQIDAEALALIDDHASKRDPNAAASDALTEALARDDVREVLGMFDTAAKIDKCDFSYAKPYWTVMYRPYHASLLACGRLLIADAMRKAHGGDIAAATRRLMQTYQLASRLASDGVIASSLTAHRMFNDAEVVVISLQKAGVLNADHLAAIKASVSGFSRGDPFHYQAAVAGMRSQLGGWFTWFVAGAPEPITGKTDPKHVEEAATLLGTFDADRLLALTAMCEEQYMLNSPSTQPIRGPIEGLGSIFDVEALQRCRDMLPTLMQWVKQGLTGSLGQVELPVIAPIEARMKQSMEDFRAAVQRLGLDEAGPATRPR